MESCSSATRTAGSSSPGSRSVSTNASPRSCTSTHSSPRMAKPSSTSCRGRALDGSVVPPPPTSKGDFLRESDRAWVDSKATPQPVATFTERLRVTGAYQRVPQKIFVRATGWQGPFDAVAARARAEPGWTVHELHCGHPPVVRDGPSLRETELLQPVHDPGGVGRVASTIWLTISSVPGNPPRREARVSP
jgi:hypothetical protein